MFLKGGILMGLAYDSPRQTADIDFTTTLAHVGDAGDMVRMQLDSMFPRAAATLGYADLVVKTHSVKKLPKAIPNAAFPALKLKIGSARRDTAQERALQTGQASVVIDTDISFNEPVLQTQVLVLTGGRELLAYSLVDLMAEKYRAILQQVTRKRNRRQDVYDLDWLIVYNEIDEGLQKQILTTLGVKCQERQIEPTRASLDDPEVKRRARCRLALNGVGARRGTGLRGLFYACVRVLSKPAMAYRLALPFTQVGWQTNAFEGVRSMSSRCRAMLGASMWHGGLSCGLIALSCWDVSFGSTPCCAGGGLAFRGQ